MNGPKHKQIRSPSVSASRGQMSELPCDALGLNYLKYLKKQNKTQNQRLDLCIMWAVRPGWSLWYRSRCCNFNFIKMLLWYQLHPSGVEAPKLRGPSFSLSALRARWTFSAFLQLMMKMVPSFCRLLQFFSCLVIVVCFIQMY